MSALPPKADIPERRKRACKGERLIRTNRACFYPDIEERAFLGLRTWGRLAVASWSPGIADQTILTHVMHSSSLNASYRFIERTP